MPLGLCLALLTAACGVCLALWPIREVPPHDWYYTYDRASSSLDVAALSLSYAVLVAFLLRLSVVAKPRLGQEQLQTRHKRLVVTLAAASWLTSLLLLAKAVLVALEADDRLRPNGDGAVGLIFMCAAACIQMLCISTERPAAVSADCSSMSRQRPSQSLMCTRNPSWLQYDPVERRVILMCGESLCILVCLPIWNGIPGRAGSARCCRAWCWYSRLTWRRPAPWAAAGRRRSSAWTACGSRCCPRTVPPRNRRRTNPQRSDRYDSRRIVRCSVVCCRASVYLKLVASWPSVLKGRHWARFQECTAVRFPFGSVCRCIEAELAVASVCQATIAVLLKLAVPDTLILLIAFSAGVVAALGQAAIPYFIGR